MKRITALLICLLCLFSSATVMAAPPQVSSASAMLVEKDTGRIMFEYQADKRVYPASTTKIMTALLAIENLDPAATLTASETAIDIDRDGSNMGILRGEALTVEQLLYGLLVHSANDAANVLAEAVAGDIPTFVEKMNQRAKDLGMTGTQYKNTHGYHDPEHYTTARDMIILCMEALKNDLFSTICSTATYEIPPTEKYKEIRYLSSNNALINPMKGHQYLYKGAKGIKTGHTDAAGYCLLSVAERDGITYICATMGSPVEYEGNASFVDTIALFDYGFTDFYVKTVADTSEIVATKKVKWAAGGDYAVLTAKEPLGVLLPKGYDESKLTKEIFTEDSVSAPLKKGDIIGCVEYFYDGVSVGRGDLVVSKDVGRSFFRMVFGTLWDVIFSIWVMGPLGLIVAILLFRYYIMANRKRRERQRRRQQFREEYKNDFYR